jgi:excisionase family DNA binding protein
MVDQVNLTINQFCEAVPCGRTKAYELTADGEIEAIKLGKKTLIPRSELERLQARLPRIRPRTKNRPDTENSGNSSGLLEASSISEKGRRQEVPTAESDPSLRRGRFLQAPAAPSRICSMRKRRDPQAIKKKPGTGGGPARAGQ